MLFKEIIAVSSENHTKPINALCAKCRIIQAGSTEMRSLLFPCSTVAASIRRQFFILVRFLVLTMASMKMTVFWDVPLIDLMMEAASTSKTSLNFYQTTRRNTPEDSHLQFFISVAYCEFSEAIFILSHFYHLLLVLNVSLLSFTVNCKTYFVCVCENCNQV
jgi:hypothetical protein